MSSQHQNPTSPNIFGSFAGIFSIIGLFIYFTGWIYLSNYYDFFGLRLNTLNLPLDSYLLAPIQVLLGDIWKFFLSLIVLILTTFSILVSLWLIHSPRVVSLSRTPRMNRFTQNLHSFLLFKKLRSFAEILPLPLRQEIVIVIWILAALFWIAQWQGYADAFRDAVNTTSTRPMITVITSSEKIPFLGRNLDDLLVNPSLKGSRIIGDVKQFQRIFGRETNDTTNPKQPIVWRLLAMNNNWAYLFPGLPTGVKSNQRPPVLAIYTGEGQVQLMIITSS
jgi:hypothetical protein